MKKILLFAISVLIILTVFIGCQQEDKPGPIQSASDNLSESDSVNNDAENISQFNDPIDSYDSEEQISVSENSEDVFILKAKKYKYYDNDVLILNVENKSASDYSITITVTYYDENGKNIGTESRVFQGFAAGWHNYFIFQPNMMFNSLDYKLDATMSTEDEEVYSGFLRTEIKGGTIGLEMNRSNLWTNFEGELIMHHDLYTGVWGSYPIINDYDETIYYSARFIVFNNKGEIYHIANKKSSDMVPLSNYSKSDQSYAQQIIYLSEILWSSREEFVWPEELKGEIKGIVCFYKIDIIPTN